MQFLKTQEEKELDIIGKCGRLYVMPSSCLMCNSHLAVQTADTYIKQVLGVDGYSCLYYADEVPSNVNYQSRYRGAATSKFVAQSESSGAFCIPTYLTPCQSTVYLRTAEDSITIVQEEGKTKKEAYRACINRVRNTVGGIQTLVAGPVRANEAKKEAARQERERMLARYSGPQGPIFPSGSGSGSGSSYGYGYR